MKTRLISVLGLILGLTLGGCAPSNTQPPLVTKDEYAKLKVGMTYQEATEIIGDDGKQLRLAKEEDGVKVETYSWKNSESSFVVALFENGKLTDKSATDLP